MLRNVCNLKTIKENVKVTKQWQTKQECCKNSIVFAKLTSSLQEQRFFFRENLANESRRNYNSSANWKKKFI